MSGFSTPNYGKDFSDAFVSMGNFLANQRKDANDERQRGVENERNKAKDLREDGAHKDSLLTSGLNRESIRQQIDARNKEEKTKEDERRWYESEEKKANPPKDTTKEQKNYARVMEIAERTQGDPVAIAALSEDDQLAIVQLRQQATTLNNDPTKVDNDLIAHKVLYDGFKLVSQLPKNGPRTITFGEMKETNDVLSALGYTNGLGRPYVGARIDLVDGDAKIAPLDKDSKGNVVEGEPFMASEAAKKSGISVNTSNVLKQLEPNLRIPREVLQKKYEERQAEQKKQEHATRFLNNKQLRKDYAKHPQAQLIFKLVENGSMLPDEAAKQISALRKDDWDINKDKHKIKMDEENLKISKQNANTSASNAGETRRHNEASEGTDKEFKREMAKDKREADIYRAQMDKRTAVLTSQAYLDETDPVKKREMLTQATLNEATEEWIDGTPGVEEKKGAHWWSSDTKGVPSVPGRVVSKNAPSQPTPQTTTKKMPAALGGGASLPMSDAFFNNGPPAGYTFAFTDKDGKPVWKDKAGNLIK
jgi:hypothetical protein